MQRVSLETALRTGGENPKGPCPGCVHRDSIINPLEEINAVLEHKLRERNAEYHKLEADYAEQTSRLSYDLDQSPQTSSSLHAGKAAADAEKNAMFKRIKFLEEGLSSMSRREAELNAANNVLRRAERSRMETPATAGQQASAEDKPSRSPSEYYDIGRDAGGEDPKWTGHPYEDEEWCYAPAPTRTTKVEAPTLTATQTVASACLYKTLRS